jgi:hypothetical protein
MGGTIQTRVFAFCFEIEKQFLHLKPSKYASKGHCLKTQKDKG